MRASIWFEAAVYVCICNGVTDREIRQAARAGCSGVAELTMRTGCGSTCGSCLPMACDVLEHEQREMAAARTTRRELCLIAIASAA